MTNINFLLGNILKKYKSNIQRLDKYHWRWKTWWKKNRLELKDDKDDDNISDNAI